MKIKINGEPATVTHWLIRADEPFRGFSQSFLLPDGTVAYTDGLTPRAYSEDRGFPVRVITTEQLELMEREHEASLITQPEEETDREWWDALEVLPPCRWHHAAGVELFHISEGLTGRLVHWHARHRGRRWHFIDRDDATSEHLAAKVREAAKAKATA